MRSLRKLGRAATKEVRTFGKPSTRPYRRMGVALALAPDSDTDGARTAARAAAERVKIAYDPRQK